MSENTVCPECGEPIQSGFDDGPNVNSFECGTVKEYFEGGDWVNQSLSCKTIQALKKENGAKDLEIEGLKANLLERVGGPIPYNSLSKDFQNAIDGIERATNPTPKETP